MALPNQHTPKCPGCKKHMAMTTGKTLHFLDKKLHNDHFYFCTCGTYEIRCHPGTIKPMGKPGDATLREERRWCGAKIDALIKGKMSRDNVTEEVATAAAWKWVSKIVQKDVSFVEELNIPEMGSLVPELRKF